ncbi:hypothetical protein ACSSS7_002869 [Eimeria intestinalis]
MGEKKLVEGSLLQLQRPDLHACSSFAGGCVVVLTQLAWVTEEQEDLVSLRGKPPTAEALTLRSTSTLSADMHGTGSVLSFSSSSPSWLEESAAHDPPHKDNNLSHHGNKNEGASESHISGRDGHSGGAHQSPSAHEHPTDHGASSGHHHHHPAGAQHPPHHQAERGSASRGSHEITHEPAGSSPSPRARHTGGSIDFGNTRGEEQGPTDAKGLKSFANSLTKAEKSAESDDINADVEFQAAMEAYLNSEDGLKLLDCIKVKPSQERKEVIETICAGMKGKLLSACLSLRTSARMLSHGIEQNCKKKSMSRERKITLNAFMPTYMYGMTATPFDFTRLSDIGKGKDLKVEGFDGFYIGEDISTYYGVVLDRREMFKNKQKRRSTRFFSRKKTKAQAIKDYGMAAVVALARAPHVDAVFVKAIMETLDLDGCPPDTTMEIHDLFGEKHEVSTSGLRKRLLAKRIGLTVQDHSPDHHPIADYNRKVFDLYLQAFPVFEALALRAQGQPVSLPPTAPEPTPQRRGALLRAIQQAVEAHAFQYLQYDRSPPSRLATFFLGNKAVRKAMSRWMQLLVKLGLPVVRAEKAQASEGAQGIVRGRADEIYPQLFLNVNATAWVEYAVAFATSSVFLHQPAIAELQAQLVSDNLKTAMMKHLQRERREADRAFERKKEEAHKEAKRLKRETRRVAKAAKKKKRFSFRGGGGDEGAGTTALVQIGRFHAASFLTSSRKRKAKIISAVGLIVALVAHIIGIVLGLGGFVFIPLAVGIVFAIILAVVWFIGRDD